MQRIKGLEKHPTILECKTLDKTIVYSHPGWRSHLIKHDEIFKMVKERCEKTNTQVPYSSEREKLTILSLLNASYPNQFLESVFIDKEIDFFNNVKFTGSTVILTVPTIWEKEYKKSKLLSENFSEYIEEITRGINYYLMPTYSSKYFEKKNKISGVFYNGKSAFSSYKDFYQKYIELIHGKEIMFAGNDLGNCLSQTISQSLENIQKAIVLVNYCGINYTKQPKDYSRKEMEILMEILIEYNNKIMKTNKIEKSDLIFI
jgi:hypothetical protein